MKKIFLSLIGTALLFLVAAPLYASGTGGGGCVESPENPTAVLAAVGSAGVFFFSRGKFRRSK